MSIPANISVVPHCHFLHT